MEKVIFVLVAVFGLFFIYKQIVSFRKGEPSKDELSSLILQKASSLSFYVSLYFWLIISYFSDRINLDTAQLIGYGIVGMAIIFAIIWAIIKLTGLKNG